MGRGPDEDPWFFASAFAAGRLARSLDCMDFDSLHRVSIEEPETVPPAGPPKRESGENAQLDARVVTGPPKELVY